MDTFWTELVLLKIIGKISLRNFFTVYNTFDKFCIKFYIPHIYGCKCKKHRINITLIEACYGEVRKTELEGIYQ